MLEFIRNKQSVRNWDKLIPAWDWDKSAVSISGVRLYFKTNYTFSVDFCELVLFCLFISEIIISLAVLVLYHPWVGLYSFLVYVIIYTFQRLCILRENIILNFILGFFSSALKKCFLFWKFLKISREFRASP